MNEITYSYWVNQVRSWSHLKCILVLSLIGYVPDQCFRRINGKEGSCVGFIYGRRDWSCLVFNHLLWSYGLFPWPGMKFQMPEAKYLGTMPECNLFDVSTAATKLFRTYQHLNSKA